MKQECDIETIDAFDTAGALSLGLVVAVRELYGMTQDVFAKLIGLHPMTVSKLERGKLPLDDELRHKLLMLKEIIEVPGVAQTVHYVAKNYSGTDALFVSLAVHKVVS